MQDSIDTMIEEWHAATPGVETGPFALTGRIQRISRYIERGLERIARRYGITRRDLSLLLAIRRVHGVVTPTVLLEEIRITSGAMTKRLEVLASAGFVERRKATFDGRSVTLHLTQAGQRIVDEDIRSGLEPEHRAFRTMDPQAVATLGDLLRDVLLRLESLEEIASESVRYEIEA